jgi:hypothetical protein
VSNNEESYDTCTNNLKLQTRSINSSPHPNIIKGKNNTNKSYKLKHNKNDNYNKFKHQTKLQLALANLIFDWNWRWLEWGFQFVCNVVQEATLAGVRWWGLHSGLWRLSRRRWWSGRWGLLFMSLSTGRVAESWLILPLLYTLKSPDPSPSNLLHFILCVLFLILMNYICMYY